MIKTPAEQEFQAELSAAVERVATRLGVSPHMNVSIHFNTYSSGALWSFNVTVPSDDKRRLDTKVSGSGDSIAEAEANVVRDYETHLRVEKQDAVLAAARKERKRNT